MSVKVGDIVSVMRVDGSRDLAFVFYAGAAMAFGNGNVATIKYPVTLLIKTMPAHNMHTLTDRVAYHVVPEHEIPDEVWAKIAEWRLTSAS